MAQVENANPTGEHMLEAGPRVGATRWFTWIYPRPDTHGIPLGYLRPGSSLPLFDPEPVLGDDRCPRFVRVVPDGFICATGAGSLDVDSPFLRAAREAEPGAGQFPYEYALSVGTHMFTRIPAPDELENFANGARDCPLRGWEETHDDLAVLDPIEANAELPEFLTRGGHAPSPWSGQPGLYFKKVPRGSMVAYRRAFEANGQVWVLASNLTVVPAAGLKRFRRSEFRGLELESGVELPVAWVRSGEPRKWVVDGERLVPTERRFKLRQAIVLTGRSSVADGQTLLETKDSESWVNAAEVSVARARKPPRALAKADEKWVHVTLSTGLLTLYRGERPVFVTLASPGVKNATPTGLERVESKHRVSTLTTENGEPKKYFPSDVPWVIYFKRPFAIHSAVWHEDFGLERSYGCVNVSPLDGAKIFDFVDPDLPPGWGSVQGNTRMGRGTLIRIQR